MTTDIVYIREDLIGGWRAACETVAAERIYLGRVELFPADVMEAFALKALSNNWPMYVALEGQTVVGWADITPVDIPECAHRGALGMGVIASRRGAGLGEQLLSACLTHAPRSGIAKVELTVFASNEPAIALYRKHGFSEIGVSHDYRRLDGVTYDAVLMEKFLS
ncbi:MAG TPA: GNAT family N-acetyltransferase [Hyphomonadaceae bacterium]|jgi:ribosomal protein S18 acetylase RimI-like enzyme|nr:GNAT family N-acetyltransferase [Hyphomonadaceae bacterium]